MAVLKKLKIQIVIIKSLDKVLNKILLNQTLLYFDSFV